ncbi:MAG: DUF116 domain-containing protein [Candidatus Hodarchaeales archaeon]|jgi:hypothetical protein
MYFPYQLNNHYLENYKEYLKKVHQAQTVFENSIFPIFKELFLDFNHYKRLVENRDLEINYQNPLIHTQKSELMLYILLIEYSNQIMKTKFDNTAIKVVVLPRCLTGPKFNLLEVKRTRVGWHKIVGCGKSDCEGWELTQIGIEHGFDVYITMGNQFNEPNFLRVFGNLRKKYGDFGLVAVACLPELALGRTFIMEMGIPTHAVPLSFPGCAKWHGSAQAVQTKFPLKHILGILKCTTDRFE